MQSHALKKENKILAEKLYNAMKDSVACNNKDSESNASCEKSSLQAAANTLGNSFQAGILLDL